MLRVLIAACVLGITACGPPHNTDPGFDGHTQYFPLVGTVHDNTDCNVCHGGFTTFTQFTCTNSACHVQAATDAAHPGVSGYVYDSTSGSSCYQCHPDGSFRHPLFPIGAKLSHVPNCNGCHVDPTNRSDLSTLQCAQCHAPLGVDTQHAQAGILDYVAAGAAGSSQVCLRCHDQSVVTPIASHPTGRSDFIGNDSHPEKCLTCHPGILVTPTNSLGTTWAADWTSQGCATCHRNGNPR